MESVIILKIECREDMLVAVDTGEVIAYTSPKFQDLTYEDYVEQGLKYLAVQEATALDNVKLQQFIREKDLLAEIKFDGHSEENGIIFR